MVNKSTVPVTKPVTKPVCYRGSRFNARFPNITFLMVQWYSTSHRVHFKSRSYSDGLNDFTEGGYKFLSITNFIRWLQRNVDDKYNLHGEDRIYSKEINKYNFYKVSIVDNSVIKKKDSMFYVTNKIDVIEKIDISQIYLYSCREAFYQIAKKYIIIVQLVDKKTAKYIVNKLIKVYGIEFDDTTKRGYYLLWMQHKLNS